MSQQTSYKVVRLLGEGSFGKAFLGMNNKNGEYCVIKQIIMEGMEEQERKDTLNEAIILKKLDHANIIKFKEVFLARKPKETLNIVTEFADGGDLEKKIKEQKKVHFPENQIIDYFTQICLALQHIHKKKIIHRDIKSGNIFLMKNGLVKLGDFGIAKGFKNTWEKAKTMVGTPYYLSPEIITSKPYDSKSDIWALGVLLYEMMTFKMPFDANSLPLLSLKICKGKYKNPPLIYSDDLKDLLKKCLTINPEKRPSVDEILKMPLIINRINGFLDEVNYKQDLSKTIARKYKEVVHYDDKISKNNVPSKQQVSSLAKSEEIKNEKKLDENKESKKVTSDKNKVSGFFEKRKMGGKATMAKKNTKDNNESNVVPEKKLKETKGFKEVLNEYGENSDLTNMHKEEYNQIRLLNNLHNIANNKEQEIDDEDITNTSISSISNASDKVMEDSQNFILDDSIIKENKKKADEKKEDDDIPEMPSDTNKVNACKEEDKEIEELRKSIESQLGKELFNDVYRYVDSSTDKTEIKFDKELLAKKIKEELSKKGYEEQKLMSSIDSLDEIFSIVIKDHLS